MAFNMLLTYSDTESHSSFPQGTEGTIKTYRSRGTNFPKLEVQQLVRALDGHQNPFCSRLDELSLVLLCTIMTYSEPCGARYRGYHLIAVREFNAQIRALKADLSTRRVFILLPTTVKRPESINTPTNLPFAIRCLIFLDALPGVQKQRNRDAG